MKNYLSDAWDKRTALKRGGGQVDFSIEWALGEERYGHVPCDQETPETLFERAWTRSLLDRVFARLRDEYHTGGRGEVYDALEGHIASGASRRPKEELATRLGMSEGNIRVALHRLRQRFRSLLTEEISETVTALAFSKDSRQLATGSIDGTAILWRLPMIEQPAPSWLLSLIESFLDRAPDKHSLRRRNSALDLAHLQSRIPGATPFAPWAEWFFQDPSGRARSPLAGRFPARSNCGEGSRANHHQ